MLKKLGLMVSIKTGRKLLGLSSDEEALVARTLDSLGELGIISRIENEPVTSDKSIAHLITSSNVKTLDSFGSLPGLVLSMLQRVPQTRLFLGQYIESLIDKHPESDLINSILAKTQELPIPGFDESNTNSRIEFIVDKLIPAVCSIIPVGTSEPHPIDNNVETDEVCMKRTSPISEI